MPSLYPKGTYCIWTRPSNRLKDKVVKCKIVDYGYQFQGKVFLHYLVEIEGEPGKTYAAYQQDLKQEKL
jgi:hypothetical protein